MHHRNSLPAHAWSPSILAKCSSLELDLTVKSVLVPPQYWGSGAAILLFDEMVRRARARGYRWIDASLTSDDNPRTPALASRLGGVLYKRYRAYRLSI